jgi:thymidylate synthase (FAD)
MKFDVLDKGYVQYVEHLGSDLSVVNAARCSFDKVKDEFDEKDTKLINYLAREKHLLPFRHPTVSLRIYLPIFVLRQLGKYQVGFSWSEVSRRYVKGDPEFYLPKKWRSAPEGSIKQGSGEDLGEDFQFSMNVTQGALYTESMRVYKALLANGAAPEMARMILPQSMYTTVYVTGSLLGWNHLYKQRTDSHAQLETQEYARAIGKIMEKLYPVSWKALNE